jgi:rubrerythrin
VNVHDVPRRIALTLMAASTGGCAPCPKDGSIDTPMSVSDWNITPERYIGILMAADEGFAGEGESGDTGDTGEGSPTWDGLDDAARCRLACASALGELYAYRDKPSPLESLTVETCALTIPTADEDGTLSCTATHHDYDVCHGGRRPRGWHAEQDPILSTQQQLDRMAVMEHVSITAFIELAAQLEARGAPATLAARCRAAAEDERRHVELLVELGAERPSRILEPAAVTTSLIEIALHNAVEGCVTETWAALLVRHQSQHALDSSVCRAFERIAADEARHAQLAWDLHAWFVLVLDPAAAGEVEAARAQALARLENTASQQALVLPRAVREVLGLPEPRLASALAIEFGRSLAQRPAA